VLISPLFYFIIGIFPHFYIPNSVKKPYFPVFSQKTPLFYEIKREPILVFLVKAPLFGRPMLISGAPMLIVMSTHALQHELPCSSIMSSHALDMTSHPPDHELPTSWEFF
jgi:hypothetical protein